MKINPCPFCDEIDAPAIFGGWKIEGMTTAFWVCCRKPQRGCGAEGPVSPTPEEAILSWNHEKCNLCKSKMLVNKKCSNSACIAS